MTLGKLCIAAIVAALIAIYCIPEADSAGTCYYYATHIASYRQYRSARYSYTVYYYYRCGWWGWRRCRGSYRRYAYYRYSFVSYTINYHRNSYCCSGYSGSQCNPICYNSCGRCTRCISPYNCQCSAGWTGSNCCSDLNECYSSNGGCEHYCHNTVGSFYCTCRSGYTRSSDGKHCKDVNECLANNGGCSHDCHNNHGSYTCSCQSGYNLVSGRYCQDVNECSGNNGGCQQNCINQPGTYHCTCNAGYTLSSNKRTCIDNNECTNGVANCNHYCLNTAGSYRCYCQSGYELAAQGDSDTCVDTQECLSNNGGCDQDCHNTIGSYYCTCANGYNLTNGHNCVDYDECSNNAHLCEHNCYNNIGSYTCDCRIGYYLDANGLDCHDINECDTDNGGCNQTCTNTIGSYECSCNVGWLLDDDNHGCSDHDECHTNVHDCDANGVCHNTHGTFYCTCNIGFRLNADGRTCDDINECAEHSSGCTQVCNNDFGSYHCTCYNGFELTSDQHNCTDINECTRNTDGCERYCHNLIGSYYCSCQIGYQVGPDLHACVGQPCIPQLTAPANGRINCTGDQVTDQSCNFTCSPGYMLYGSQQRNCLLNNAWTGDSAECRILSCPELEATGNAYIYTQDCRSEFGTTCEIRCVDGYYINDTTPYYQKCIVDAATNQVYWSRAPECEYVPPCSSSPCQHNGRCQEVNPTKYICDCSGTYYTGTNCEIGYVDVPDIPFVDVNSLYSFTVTAQPERGLELSVTTSSPSLGISEDHVVFNSTYQSHTFSVSSSTPGLYTISFTLTGAGAVNYEAPKPVLVVVKDPTSSHVANQYFSTVNQPVGQLLPGCCSPGGQIYQCPFSMNTVTFSSTCGWNVDDKAHETQGIVFASGSGLSLPFSVAGLELMIDDYEVTFGFPDDGGSCTDCPGGDDSCYNYDVTPDDMVDLMQSNSIARTYLTQAADLLPTWLSFSVENMNVTDQKFSLADYTASVSTGASAYLIPGCSSLDLNPTGLYSIFNYNDAISMDLDGQTKRTSGTPVCFAIDLCAGTNSPVHVTIPDDVETQLLTLSQFQTYLRNGWRLDLQEAQVKRTGVDPPTELPPDYWVGGDTLVDTNAVLPDFDIRLEMDASTTFYEQPNVGVNFMLSGDLYHNSEPSGAEIQGMLTGDITVLVNMTLNGMVANMTLLTTSSPALFTMPDKTTSASLIRSGAAMKLNLFTQANDKFFRSVLPFPAGRGSCPMETFVDLTAQNTINSITGATWCTGLSMMGYVIPPGTIRTNLFISGATKPTTPSPSYGTSTFVAQSFLTTDSKRLQLNEFVTVVQPVSGPAASIGYSAGNTVSGSIAQADVSVLGTHFSTSLTFSSSGFTFQTTAELYNTFTADISGSMPIGKSWDDFSLVLNGQFAAGADGFVTNLQSYVYEYTRDAVSAARTRAQLAGAAVNSSLEAIAAFNPVISDLHDKNNDINEQYMAAKADVMNANASYQAANNAATGLSELAHNIFQELLNVCPDHMCMNECMSSSFCRDLMKEVYINEHGIANVVRLEQMLQSKEVTSMSEKWTSDFICRVMTKIKGWADVAYGQSCSYPFIYETMSDTEFQAYYTDVNVSRSEQTVINSHQYNINEPNCETMSCGVMMPSMECMYDQAACGIARTPILNSLNSTEAEAVAPFINAIMARQNLTAAKHRLATLEQMRNVTQQSVDDATATYQALQNEHTHARTANMSVQAAEAPLLSLGSYLDGITIENLFSISTISFMTTITDTSPQVLPISISYDLAGLGTHQVSANAEFTASQPVLKRHLATAILKSVGSVLSQHISKRSVVLPTFNERQFEQRCAMIKSIKQYLEQIRDSISATRMKATDACANLTDTINALNNSINYVPSDYSNINFTYLADMYNTLLTPEQVTALARADPNIMSMINSTMKLRDLLIEVWERMPLMAATNWMVDIKSAHQSQKIGSIAGRGCYSFSDCLNMATYTIWEVLEDTPSSTTTDAWSQALPMARQQILELALNTSLNLTLAATRDWYVINIVDNLIASNYWCAGLPTIPQALEPSVAVEVGDTITIQCPATSDLPMTYQWKKDGFVISGQTQMTLTKTNANKDDEGQYQCLVSNAVGTVQSTFTEVVIYIPPVITLNPSDYEVYEGDDNGGYFACNATGHPIPMFQWYFRHQNSTEWTVIANTSNELVIPKPTKADQGWYRCSAVASIGHAMSEAAHLSVVGASASTILYNVYFMMNVTSTVPVEGSGAPDTAPPTTTIDYFRNELTLGKAMVDHLQVGFNVDNNVILVHIRLNAYYKYMPNETMEVQAPIARMYWRDLNSALNQLENRVQNGVFWFEVEGNYFETVHQSASVSDLMYWCPDGSVLKYSNFLCISCSPGTYYMRINGTGTCQPCPMNSYQDQDGAQSCIDCQPMSETVSSGSRWNHHCISYCPPGYNSSTGLEPCSICPSCTYNDDFKQTFCIPCTNAHVENGTIGCPANCTVESLSTSLNLMTILPAIIGGIVAAIIVLVLVFIVVGAVFARKNKKGNNKGRVSTQARHSIAVPNDVLSLVPDAEQKQPQTYDIRDDDVEDNDREVVNPLFMETQGGGGQGDTTYESLSHLQLANEKEELAAIEKERAIERERAIEKERAIEREQAIEDELAKEEVDLDDDDEDLPGYTQVAKERDAEMMSGVGGVTARKAALFGR